MVHFDPTITLGALLNAAIFLGGIITAIYRLGRMAETLAQHSLELTKHAERMDQHDRLLMDMVGNVQRLIGRIESIQLRETTRRPRDA